MSSRELAIEKNKPPLNIYIVCRSPAIFHSDLFNMKRFTEVSQSIVYYLWERTSYFLYFNQEWYSRSINFLLSKKGICIPK